MPGRGEVPHFGFTGRCLLICKWHVLEGMRATPQNQDRVDASGDRLVESMASNVKGNRTPIGIASNLPARSAARVAAVGRVSR